jgi:hypothetical protein
MTEAVVSKQKAVSGKEKAATKKQPERPFACHVFSKLTIVRQT